MATPTCNPVAIGIPTMFDSSILVDNVNEITANGQNLFTSAVPDGTEFTWFARVDAGRFRGPSMMGTVSCSSAFDFNSGFCTINLDFPEDSPPKDQRISIRGSRTTPGDLQNIGPDDSPIILPRQYTGFDYIPSTDGISGNLVNFDTLNCDTVSMSGLFTQSLDLNDSYCTVTFTGIPPSRPDTEANNCGANLVIQGGTSRFGLQNVRDRLNNVISFPRDLTGLSYTPQIDSFSGERVNFDTCDCESGSKTIDAASMYCRVEIQGLPENPNCGADINIIGGTNRNGYQGLLNGDVIVLPSEEMGFRFNFAVDAFGNQDRLVFDTIGCTDNGGEIELNVDADLFCLVTFLTPITKNNGGSVTVVGGTNRNSFQGIANCGRVLLPRNRGGLFYLPLMPSFAGIEVPFDTLECDTGELRVDATDGFCLVTFCGLPLSSSENGGGLLNVEGGTVANGYQGLTNGDTALLPRDVQQFRYIPRTVAFEGPSIDFDTLDCPSGSITVDVSDRFCRVRLCGIPDMQGASISLQGATSSNGYGGLTNEDFILLPRDSVFVYRSILDGGSFAGSFIQQFDTKLCTDTDGITVDTSNSFCLVTVLCCGCGVTVTIDILNKGGGRGGTGSMPNGYRNLQDGSKFLFPSNELGLYEIDGIDGTNNFDTFGCEGEEMYLNICTAPTVSCPTTPCPTPAPVQTPEDTSCLTTLPPQLPSLTCDEDPLSDFFPDFNCMPVDEDVASCPAPTPPNCRFLTQFPTESMAPSESSSPSSLPSTSVQPSRSDEPSEMPSLSLEPSADPSDGPSAMPSESLEPSGAPSNAPTTSLEPSDSSSPSEQPSASDEPSDEPSVQPSISQIPSLMPSLSEDPSSEPSETPSVSDMPSVELCPSDCFEDAPTVSNAPSGSNEPSLSDEPSVSLIPSISGEPSTSQIPSMIPSTSNVPSVSEQPSVSEEPSAFCPETCFDGIPTECLEPPTCSTSSSSSSSSSKSSTGSSSSSSKSSTGSSSSSSKGKGKGKGKGKSKIKSSSCSDDRVRVDDLPEVEESPNTRGGIAAASEFSQSNDLNPGKMILAIVAAIVVVLSM